MHFQNAMRRLSSVYNRGRVSEGQDIMVSDGKNLLEEYDNFNNKDVTLSGALHLLGAHWLIVGLDLSLDEVREKKKNGEDHDQYFKEQVDQKLRKLSLKYHPDKHDPVDRDKAKHVQQIINATRDGLSIIHKYCMEREYLRYKVFLDMSVSVINRKDMIDLINPCVVRKLEDLTRCKYGDLLEKRNVFLKKAEESVDAFQDTLKDELTRGGKSITQSANLKDTFADNVLETYIERGYKQHLISSLEELKKECKIFKDLERIRPEISKLLEESNVQYWMLKKCHKLLTSNKIIDVQKAEEYKKADLYFVQPIIQYTYIVTMYYRLLIKLCEKPSYFKALRIGIFGRASTAQVANKEVVEKSERYMKEFSLLELNDVCSKLIRYYCYRLGYQDLDKFFNEKIRINISKDETQETIKEVLIIGLKEYQRILKETFKEQETFYKKQRKLAKEESQRTKKINEELKEKADVLALQKQELARKNQEIQQINLEKEVIKTFWSRVSNLDEKLREIISKSDDKITKEVAQCVQEHGYSPEQVVDAVIEEIKFYQDQIISNGEVNFSIIESGIRHFLSQGCSSTLDSINVNQSTLSSTIEFQKMF